jgi:type II secretory pathway component PulC
MSGNKQAPVSLDNLRGNKEKADQRADRMVTEILKRPLFTPGRQPPQPKIVKAEPPVLQGRLAGVMLRPDSRIALFTRPGGRPVSIKEGEVIDGWTAAKIEESRVTLTSAFGEQVVKPTNGAADEMTPGRRPVKKVTPTKNQPAKPGQNAAPAQKSQQLASGTTGKK